MVIQLLPAGNEHLRNDVLIDIAYIGIQLATQEFLIDDVFGESIIPKFWVEYTFSTPCKNKNACKSVIYRASFVVDRRIEPLKTKDNIRNVYC